VRRRIAAQRPLFGLKWCCIMLNCFLPDMVQRIQFADPLHDTDQRKRDQLRKAATAFTSLKEQPWPM
jgi:hypothetical protein